MNNYHGEVRLGDQIAMATRVVPATVISDGQPQVPTLGPAPSMSSDSSQPTTPTSIPSTPPAPSHMGPLPPIHSSQGTLSPEGLILATTDSEALSSTLASPSSTGLDSSASSLSSGAATLPASPSGSATLLVSNSGLSTLPSPSQASGVDPATVVPTGFYPAQNSLTTPASAIVVHPDGQPQVLTPALHLTRRMRVQPRKSPFEAQFEYVACARENTLRLTLYENVLTESLKNRTAYIASNGQFQFDAPPQAGAIITAGFSMCSNGSLALGSRAIFWECLSGDFYNLYNQNIAPQCLPIALNRVRLMDCP